MCEQVWDAARYARNARFVADLGAPLVDRLAPRPGERILDLGCGDGALTVRLAAAGARVTGVDMSPDQVRAARERGVDARVMDGAALDFDAEFDAVFSNAALHWMRDADAVVDGVWRALRPGGRVVAEFGAEGNVAVVRAALRAAATAQGHDPAAVDLWYFPSPAAYRALLERRGFEVEEIVSFARPTPLPGDLRDWLETFCAGFLGGLDPAARAAFIDAVREAARARLQAADGSWTLDYVRLRVQARRPNAPAG